jgi:hypothetical protein
MKLRLSKLEKETKQGSTKKKQIEHGIKEV